MASLPSLATSSTTTLPDLRKHSSINDQRAPPTAPEAVAKEPFPSAFYVPLLHRCAETKSTPLAESLHAHIVKTGTVQDLFVATSMVNTYMKCGSVASARNLFDEFPQRNVVTWTALIAGYVRNSEPASGVVVFVRMLESGCYPTNYTLGSVLNACSALRSVEVGQQVHGYVVKYGLEMDTSIGNSLCSLYSKCGRLELAAKAFQRIPERNVISWTTIVSACGDNGDADMGLRLFRDMLREGCEPNEFTLTSAMSLCCVAPALSLGKQVHALSIKYACESSLPVKNSIMYLYLKCGEIDKARKFFDGMETVSLITWNAMIAGHAQMMGLARDDATARLSGLEALNLFLRLTRSGTKPDLFSFSSVLSVCSSLVALEQGEQFHAQALKSGFLSDVVVSSALVNMYNKCGCIEKASKTFIDMPVRTLISWTSMITGYSQHGRSREAIELFEDMRLAGVKPNQVTFLGVLSACSHAGLVDEANYYFHMMTNEYGIRPVMDHFACMVDMFVRLGRLEDAFGYISSTGFEPNEVIWSILIAGCRSQGRLDLGFYAAGRLLELRPKAIETYVLLLNMYVSAGRWQDVAKVRRVMKDGKIGSVKDRSWITVKDKVHFFRADDRSHSRGDEMYEFLERLIERAKDIGYVPYTSVEVPSEGEDEEKTSRSTLHHSERLAVAFGLLNLPEGASVRVVKNISMCRDCHSSIKFFSLLTGREIVVRDSKRLHRFKDGQCSCGDFGALL
ncbi:pentatricopeptide repeat-containing protein-like [Iris pallida]|uniref:Pentatricopeptide repeat-containing protein-like n=1 Tax=Iris pallida TaxID=29817 RepID=A0AAX6HZP4_IRIPA|nr:pentatricopeptide repeat-containing protein-like [Iris pallida]